MRRFSLGLLLTALLLSTATGQQQHHFELLVLGSEGGLVEGNLTSFLVAKRGSNRFVALDAGTLLSGLRAVQRKGNLKGLVPRDTPLTPEGWMMREGIQGYLLSHAHFDHTAGLVINSPDDAPKPIYGLDLTINQLRDNVFNWQVWANFADEGVKPHLARYRYQRLKPYEKVELKGPGFTLRTFPLNHAGRDRSTAFLLGADPSNYLLFLGDTGPDAVEGGDRLQRLWSEVAPLIAQGQLRALMLECSFANGRPDDQLFGHLTPQWMFTELKRLEGMVAPDGLKGLKVVVFHMKPNHVQGSSSREQIIEQLRQGNTLGVEFVFPQQGDRLCF